MTITFKLEKTQSSFSSEWLHIHQLCSSVRGYAAPEYIATGEISTKQDVYGFGIVLLEIMGGKLCNSYIRKRGITSLGLSLPEYVSIVFLFFLKKACLKIF